MNLSLYIVVSILISFDDYQAEYTLLRSFEMFFKGLIDFPGRNFLSFPTILSSLLYTEIIIMISMCF